MRGVGKRTRGVPVLRPQDLGVRIERMNLKLAGICGEFMTGRRLCRHPSIQDDPHGHCCYHRRQCKKRGLQNDGTEAGRQIRAATRAKRLERFAVIALMAGNQARMTTRDVAVAIERLRAMGCPVVIERANTPQWTLESGVGANSVRANELPPLPGTDAIFT